MIKEIVIDNGICFMCGKPYVNTKSQPGLKKTKNHCIPRCLKPKLNVIIPLHENCHKKLNALYKSQSKKTNNNISDSKYRRIRGQLNSLQGVATRFSSKINNIMQQVEEKQLGEIKK